MAVKINEPIRVLRVLVFPVGVRIWKHREQYLAVVTDPATIQALMPYTKRKVVFELMGIEVTAPLQRLNQRLIYVGVYLPRRLNLMWHRLWEQGDTYKAQIRVVDNGSNQTIISAPGEPSSIGDAA